MSFFISPKQYIKNQKSAFETQFAGMTIIPFTYMDYETTRLKLIEKFKELLKEEDKQFIMSFEKGEPDWDLFKYPTIKDFPAINWKLLNVNKLKKENPQKHTAEIEKLNTTLIF